MKSVLTTALRTTALFVATTGIALASDGTEIGKTGNWGWGVGAGLAIGVAALGGGLGQARTAAAAIEGMARNPQAADKLQTPMILGLAFIESLVLFGLIVGMKLAGVF